jgi:hypothetical protein
MNKYDRLRDYLFKRNSPEIVLTMSEIEEIMDANLPGTAEIPHWWKNERSAVTSNARLPAWEAAGYEAIHPQGSDYVIFRRFKAEPQASASGLHKRLAVSPGRV